MNINLSLCEYAESLKESLDYSALCKVRSEITTSSLWSTFSSLHWCKELSTEVAFTHKTALHYFFRWHQEPGADYPGGWGRTMLLGKGMWAHTTQMKGSQEDQRVRGATLSRASSEFFTSSQGLTVALLIYISRDTPCKQGVSLTLRSNCRLMAGPASHG